MQDFNIRQPLLNDLNTYNSMWGTHSPIDTQEPKDIVQAFTGFITENSDCFERSNLKGHITASGFIVDTSFTEVLLTHHAKLNDWLQLGGHADGEPFAYDVALKECQEESGLNDFKFVQFWKLFKLESPYPLIFDLDKHLIPARKNEPEHFHYDVRYLLVADKENPLQISEESKDLKWVPLKEAYEIARQSSMHRPFRKIEFIRDRLASN